MKYTKKDIEELALEIYEKLKEHEMSDALCIYFNGKRINTYSGKFEIQKGIDPHDYCKYAAYEHLITICSEGGFHDYMEYFYEEPKWLEKLLDKYDLYIEQCSGCFWSICDATGKNEWEYTMYEEPMEEARIR